MTYRTPRARARVLERLRLLRLPRILGLVLLGAAGARGAAAQDTAALDAMASWVALDVATGYEARATTGMAEAMPGWSVDWWGNLVARVGSGTPRRILACALDEPAYAASQITDDGYLRVHRIGGGSRHPLWDQAFEAQQVRVLTLSGPIAGVVARDNGHFAQQHRGENDVVDADDLWMDVGAESADEVAALGIGLLDPIVRHLPPWPFAGGVAGPAAGARVGCAAVASLAARALAGEAPAGETTFVLSSQTGLGWVGLSSVVARGGPLESVTVLAPGEATASAGPPSERTLGRFGPVLEARGVARVTWVVPAVRSPGAHLEVVSPDQAAALLSQAADAIGMRVAARATWQAAPERPALRTAHMDPALDSIATMLTELVERPGVSGHEWSVRRFVLESLPAWARDRAVVDDVGDIMVEAGPDRDTTVFMAHTDEVGYTIESIAPDGVVSLERQGGAVASAWEGQTALVHFDPAGAPSTNTGTGADTDPRWKRQSLAASAPASVPGVFLTRDEADRKSPPPEQAWFGLDAGQLAERGIAVGAMITSYKDGLRLGRSRYTARALDDRAGTLALLLAIRSIDPDALPAKVIFTWSVHEEGGLLGAAAMALRYGASARRIFSVDTFVSSDTPLESPHFAHVPLGDGPVLRAVDNSAVSPDAERKRIFAAAEAAGVHLQMGLTQGSTDGTQFTFWGTPNQGISWPGRYSHSPGEVLDLRDLRDLSRLIGALAVAGEG